MSRSRQLGRLHSAREALDAIAIARSSFDRYSFDLIYARPGQTPDAWTAELERAIAEAGDHLSLYQLTIEPETPFFALHAAGKLAMPDEDTARALYDTTQSVCAARRSSRLRDFQSRAGGRANAGTTSSTGVRTNMPASVRARTAGSTSTGDRATPPPPSGGRRHG